MRIVELRRHAERDENEDLTATGLAGAARARETLEFPFDAYVISPAKRARLTMAAFGVEDARVEPRIGPHPRPPFLPFGPRHDALMATGMDAVTAWFAIPECLPILLEHGRRAAEGALDIAARLPEGGRALAVSHGGTIEPFAVAAACRAYEQVFGRRGLEHCEGVRAFVVDGRVTRLDVVRLVA